MASRIPAGYVVRTGFKGNRLRIDTEGIMESGLHFGQNILHRFVSSNRDATRDFPWPDSLRHLPGANHRLSASRINNLGGLVALL